MERQRQLPFASVRRQGRRDESPDFGAVAVADPEISEGGVVFPSDSGSSAESSQIIVPATPPESSESPESPYYRHDSQAAQRQPSMPSPPRQLTPEQIAYLQAEEQWRQERLQRQRQAELDQRSFQAGLRSERAFYEGEFPITRTAPGPNPNEPDYSRPGQTDDRYPWQIYTGRAQQRQRDIATAAAEQRQQTRETRESRETRETRESKQEELNRLADEARQLGRRRQGGHGSSRRKSATAASKRKKIKLSKRKSKYTRKSNKNKMQRKKSQRRN